MVTPRQYDVHHVNLDPTVGREIRKTRPCLVLSPDEMNATIGTVIIAPMTTKSHAYPTRVPVSFDGKDGWIVLDHLRTVERERLAGRIGAINKPVVARVKRVLSEMLVE